ncbi:MAG: hypothetical protein MRY59_13015 [Aquisalinus sp.]|nr:hypothetical protein [Aquisalinus sp.]
MSAGPFIWKYNSLSPQTELFILDDGIILTEKNETTEIKFSDIAEVYVHYETDWPTAYRIDTEIVAKDNHSISFANAGSAFRKTQELEICLQANVALLEHLTRFDPEFGVYQGIRPDKFFNPIFILTTIIIWGGIFFYLFHDLEYENLAWWNWAIVLGFVTLAAAITAPQYLALRRIYVKPRKVLARDFKDNLIHYFS